MGQKKSRITGNIICCSLTEFKTEDGKRILGANHLWRILVSESAHLIWKLRCKRVKRNENTPFTEEEIRNRWYKMLDIRLEIDCYMTKPSYDKKGMKTKIVTQMWTGTLEKEDCLPRNWTGISRVLVGRSQVRQQGVG